MPELRFEALTVVWGAEVVLRDGRAVALAARAHRHRGDERIEVFTGGGLVLEVALAREEGGYGVSPVLRGDAALLGQVDQVVVLDAELGGVFSRYYSARREIWLPVSLRAADGTFLPDGPPTWDTGLAGATNLAHHADNLIAVYNPGAAALLCGVVMPAQQGLEMTYAGGRLRVMHRVEQLPAGATAVVIDRFVLRYGSPLLESLEAYGRMNRLTHRRPEQRAAMTAWNSWDYYEAHITQADMLAAARSIAADAGLKARIDAIVLDDGWATLNGDWEPNLETFPDLAGMAAQLRSLGFVPGIWYSPFRVSAKCRWAAAHPETVLWGPSRGFYPKAFTPEAPTRTLDPTHPLVLRKIFDDLSRLRAMGFGYFKTDFIQAVNTNFMRADFFDKSVSPVEAVRRAMHTIRAAIGYDAFWLACGTEFLSVAGLPDAARISDDITERFGTLQVAVRHCAMYFWANGNLWLTDPDFLVVRGQDTSRSPHLHKRSELGNPRPQKPYQRVILDSGEFFTLEEARTWANFHLVYGGTLAWSDPPGQINAQGRALLDMVLKYHEPSGPGVPLDLEERNLPRKWLRPTAGGYLLGVFNFDDAEQAIAVSARDLARAGTITRVSNLWTHEPVATNGRGLAEAILLPAHQSRVLLLETEQP